MSGKTRRDHIVEAADQLFYQQGYEHTSFKHIAETVKISRGNFYHHFKSKDDILDAVIKHRLSKTQAMLDQWQGEGETPEQRIKSFIHILLVNWPKIQHYGCPVGTLCTELAKLNHASQDEANQVFTLFRHWLAQQFTLLGHEAEADKLAMHVLARSQGIATLGNTFQDKAFVQQEVELLCDWLTAYT